MEGVTEGKKELLWMAIKKVCAKERLLVCKNGKFLRTARKGLCKNEELLYVKGQLLRAVRKLSVTFGLYK